MGDEASADPPPARDGESAGARPVASDQQSERSPELNAQDEKGDRDPHFGKEPDAAERAVPRIARTLGNAYHFGGGSSGDGPAAYGDNATALSVTLATAPEGAKFWLEPIGADFLAAALETYVRTGVEHDIDRVLRTQGLAYLAGDSGTGRRTVALAALSRANPGSVVTELHAIRGSTLEDLAQQSDFRSEPGCWLVRWDGLPDRIVLASLAGLAKRLKSHLVVIGGPDEQNRELSRYLVDHRGSDPVTVFLAHLSAQLCAESTCLPGCAAPGDCAGQCITMLIEQCADADLASELATVRQPYLLVGLARAVAGARPASAAEVRDRVRVSMPTVRPLAAHLLRGAAKADDVVEPDPRRGHDPAVTFRRCFRIAYALMSNCPIGLVAEAAKQLVTIMLPEATADDENALRRTWDEFGFMVDELVPAEMRSDTMPEDAESNGDAGRMAWLADNRLMGSVLDVAWNDYPHGQDGLMRWLEELGSHGSPLVRQRAAIAAGFLASFDFERVYYGLLGHWATSQRYQRRHAAGLAMAFSVLNPAIAFRVQNRVYRWAHDEEFASPRLRDTALRAHVAGMATQLPVRHVLDDLREIAKHDSHKNSRMIGMSVEEITNLSTVDTVLAELAKWQDSDALLALHSARSVLALMGKEDAVDDRAWPLLLRWVGHDSDRRTRLIAVLEHSLLRQETSFRSWQALGGWLAAEGDSELTEVLFAVLTELLTPHVLQVRARFYLDRVWRPLMPLNPALDRIGELVEVAA